MKNHKKTTAQDVPDSHERRKAIKKIAAGVGVLAGFSVLPEKWTQPIVEKIVLPAHAATSGVTLEEMTPRPTPTPTPSPTPTPTPTPFPTATPTPTPTAPTPAGVVSYKKSAASTSVGLAIGSIGGIYSVLRRKDKD